jgi:hypothetical protein
MTYTKRDGATFLVVVATSRDVTVSDPNREIGSQCPVSSLPAPGSRFVNLTVSVTSHNSRPDTAPIIVIATQDGHAFDEARRPESATCVPTAMQYVDANLTVDLGQLNSGASTSRSATVMIPPQSPPLRLVAVISDVGSSDPNRDTTARVLAIDP